MNAIDPVLYAIFFDTSLEDQIRRDIERGICSDKCGRPWAVLVYKKDTDSQYGFCKD